MADIEPGSPQYDPITQPGVNMDRQSIAERIAAGKGPKITQADIDGAIARAQYWQPDGTTQTVCCVQLVNGFTVVGSSACADPANFDESLGRALAFDDARDQIWFLLGFQLREELYRANLRIGAQVVAGKGAAEAAEHQQASDQLNVDTTRPDRDASPD
jgi:hypothetical protein